MTVCLMCPMMSFVATVLFKGVDSQIIAKWLQTSALNFPMALCWAGVLCGTVRAFSVQKDLSGKGRKYSGKLRKDHRKNGPIFFKKNL